MRPSRYDVRATPRTTSFAEGARRCRPAVEAEGLTTDELRIVVDATADFTARAFNTADFTTADFTTADFTTADFTTADFTTADFTTADFTTADFTTADFAAALVETADCPTTDFKTADFFAAAFEAAIVSAREGEVAGDCWTATRGGIFRSISRRIGLLDGVRSCRAGGRPDGSP
jgi:uncharacterized protein YjbI with pentapeptide repeats